MKTPWEEAAEFSDPIWASVAEDVLTEAGFTVMLRTSGPGPVYPGTSTVWRLFVAEGRAREARNYLENHFGPDGG